MRHSRGKVLSFLTEANGAVVQQGILDEMGVLM